MKNLTDTLQWPARMRPKWYFRNAEDYSIRIRKLLQELRPRCRDSELCGSVDDAVKLAVLIEQMSIAGRSFAAEEAFDQVERVESLVDLLVDMIDALLASTSQSALD